MALPSVAGDPGRVGGEGRWQRLLGSRVAVVGAVALATAGSVGGWAIYLDLHHFLGRGALAYGVLFAFVPVLPLSAVLVWLDRMRPQPVWLLVAALLWGALGASYAAIELNDWLATKVGDAFGASVRSAVFIAPWVEEAAKGAVLFAIAWWRRRDLTSVLAGVVYGGLAGVGFAFTENIVYYGQLFQQVKDFKGSTAVALDAVERLFLWRGVAAPFVHPMFTIMTGIGVGIAVRTRHPGVRIVAPVAGFLSAVALHMGYNAATSFAAGRALTAFYLLLLLPALSALIAVVLSVRRHEQRLIAARLADYAAYGWLGPGQIALITTGGGRRRARRYARSGDRSQRDLLRRYLQTGVDLGVVRDQMVRGVAGPDLRARESQLLESLRELRRVVRLPGSDATPELSREFSSW